MADENYIVLRASIDGKDLNCTSNVEIIGVSPFQLGGMIGALQNRLDEIKRAAVTNLRQGTPQCRDDFHAGMLKVRGTRPATTEMKDATFSIGKVE